MASLQLPGNVRAHSIRKQAASAASFRGVPILDICRASTRSDVRTFTKHSSIVEVSCAHSQFGRAVLKFLF